MQIDKNESRATETRKSLEVNPTPTLSFIGILKKFAIFYLTPFNLHTLSVGGFLMSQNLAY
jgi:hypothetical protein